MISIIVGFRNRDLERVKNSLDSLNNQTCKSFELIFVDYGSDPDVAIKVERLVQTYSFVKYIYNETRGMFWNRSHALNTGIKEAKGDCLIISDIDLCFPTCFLENLLQKDLDRCFYNFDCFYLPEHVSVEDLSNINLSQISIGYVGLCAVSRVNVLEINGFDEFYQVWGAEDDDFYLRLELFGCHKVRIDANVCHQWHPSQAPTLPDMWYLKMVDHLFSTCKPKVANFGRILSKGDRPALCAFLDKSYRSGQCIELNFYNKTSLYNKVIEKLNHPNENQLYYVEYNMSPTYFHPIVSWIILKFNIQMKKYNRNLRLINNIQVENKQLMDNLNAFFKYIVGAKRSNIKDYYLDWRDDGFVFVFCN